ncbi:MAG: 2-phospho-L-lactate transferase CofD family protein, partial [Pyrinomonadaceae bacterium]
EAEALESFRIIGGRPSAADAEFPLKLKALLADVDAAAISVLAQKLAHFEREMRESGRVFSFSDCSIGNLVFAGCFLEMGRDFNRTIADYCAFLGLPENLIENVTDGADAHLVAIDCDARVLASEADIVDANRRNHIKDIYLIDRPLTGAERDSLGLWPAHEAVRFLERRATTLVVNPRLLDRIAEADLLIYSPGTQHSSLFPSYLTPGLGTAIARNLTAIKLLITNIQEDAEIADSSAVDIIDKAVHYLKEKDQRRIPTPCLITHYLLNDKRHAEPGSPYVPLGRLETLEDPRLVRIGNYEEGVTGCHDAAKVLTPFIESFLREERRQRIAVLLLGADSVNKICQTLLEMLRGGIERLPADLTVFYAGGEPIDPAFTQSLPFEVYNVPRAADGAAAEEISFQKALREHEFDYVVLFESSGMYKGEDIVNVVELLNHGRLDAVWGSRRLSVKDIHQSYALRYRHKVLLGALSYLGSHLLSLAYLALYGRYISDTLSGVRAIRASYMGREAVDLSDKCVNQHVLSMLLSERAEIFETPVQFFSISPDKVRRTTALDGLRSLMTALRWRLKAPKYAGAAHAADERVVRTVVPPAHALSVGEKPAPTEAVSSSR